MVVADLTYKYGLVYNAGMQALQFGGFVVFHSLFRTYKKTGIDHTLVSKNKVPRNIFFFFCFLRRTVTSSGKSMAYIVYLM